MSLIYNPNEGAFGAPHCIRLNWTILLVCSLFNTELFLVLYILIFYIIIYLKAILL